MSEHSNQVPQSAKADCTALDRDAARFRRKVNGRRKMSSPLTERRPLLHDDDANRPLPGPSQAESMMTPTFTPSTTSNQWILLAVASGACAAFNGVFAKLTTTELTTTLSQALATFLHLSAFENGIELVVRGTFFGLNLVFNGVMWSLFTAALARGHSTTQVSIMNTSANFVITAMLGFAIFSEALPPLWWAGATLLIAGNVIIGRKDESQKSHSDGEVTAPGVVGANGYDPIDQADATDKEEDEDEDILELGDLDEAPTEAAHRDTT